MPNMIQNAKDSISQILNAAYQKAAEKGELPAGAAARLGLAVGERLSADA